MKKITYLYLPILVMCLGWACDHTNINNLELDRYEAEIVEFERENQYQGAPAGAVVFLGGKHIRQWETLQADLQGMPAINRAFGEATLREILHYYRRLLDPFQAEVLVMNAGESDILLGADPEDVFQSFQDFLVQIGISQIASRVVYISVVPSPAHWSFWPELESVNQRIQEVADANSRVEFVDVTREFLGADGQPIEQLFKSDGYQLNQAGYARLSNAVVPVVSRMF